MKRILMVIVVCSAIVSCAVTKRDVPGIEGQITLHPDEIKLQGNDKSIFYLFYDFDKKVLFVSSSPDIYKKFAGHLTEEIVSGKYIKLQGTLINPLTFFTSEQLAKESKRIGQNLNKFKVVKITNWGLGTSETTQVKKNTWAQ